MRTTIIIIRELLEMQRHRPHLPNQNVHLNKALVVFMLSLRGKHLRSEQLLRLHPQYPFLF